MTRHERRACSAIASRFVASTQAQRSRGRSNLLDPSPDPLRGRGCGSGSFAAPPHRAGFRFHAPENPPRWVRPASSPAAAIAAQPARHCRSCSQVLSRDTRWSGPASALVRPCPNLSSSTERWWCRLPARQPRATPLPWCRISFCAISSVDCAADECPSIDFADRLRPR